MDGYPNIWKFWFIASSVIGWVCWWFMPFIEAAGVTMVLAFLAIPASLFVAHCDFMSFIWNEEGER